MTEKYVKIGFSQNGEDDYIRGFFWEQILQGYRGTYIDIGCFDERLYSNTKLLSLIGWKGIAIDANPDLEQKWLQERPSDNFLNVCINSSKSVLSQNQKFRFFRFSDGALSTADIMRAKNLVRQGSKLIDIIDVPALTLDSLFERCISIGINNPDLISIDLEMIDYLDDLPKFLKKLQPKLLCLEIISENVGICNFRDSRESHALQKAGYTPLAIFGGNLFAKPCDK